MLRTGLITAVVFMGAQVAVGAGPENEPVHNALTPAEKAAGWTLLFDGTSVDHWRGFGSDEFPTRGWVPEDGALHCRAGVGSGDIITREQYGDFEFACEWKVGRAGNSGIMYRVTEDGEATWHTGPEMQILDNREGHDAASPLTSAGALYALIACSEDVAKPADEWNKILIRIRDGHAEHWVNGRRVVEYEWGGDEIRKLIAKSKFSAMPHFMTRDKGHIALQDHGNDVWFRDLKIRALPPEREIELFNGRDLDGWTAHLDGDAKMADVWRVEDGVLICKGTPAGYIKTTKDYTNYVLRLKWRFDPAKGAGNSGVLLRQVGQDMVWPKSVEAQLHSGNAGDFWCIEQFPMKTDPARVNGRNTKKLKFAELPLGEWNEYQIVVNGGSVVLYVNGEYVNEAWDVEEVPGRICLQSEGAEIHFKDIRLTPLD